ncbi:hypothetical protein [Larkinella terrae]|uniref:Uncharacterized protein n=1 Tax=Larkinella terrae TaxID=2025311 RepID=A0A7K0EFW2_9BACT|nr:hypothetical protein [Larkinella terrae]MRS60740.1 hypothetical protein [Larkinella terrae]
MSWKNDGPTGNFTENLETMEPLKNPIADLPLLNQCHTENQRWSVTLTSYEQEVDQLLVLLNDVLEQYNHQNLRQRAIDYSQRLNRLKVWFHRLRADLLCEGSGGFAGCQKCGKPHLSLYSAISLQIAGLSDEFTHLKTGCYQFLSVLVQLNLL